MATTLPGMAGAPQADDVSVPVLARRAGELAKEHGCDVVAGFSHDATVALEMLLSGHFQGRVVLLGISLTTEDEAFFHAAVRVSQKAGSWQMTILFGLLPLMARSAKTPEPHKRELIEDLKQNRAGDSARVSGEYLDYIAADRDYAALLATSATPGGVGPRRTRYGYVKAAQQAGTRRPAGDPLSGHLTDPVRVTVRKLDPSHTANDRHQVGGRAATWCD